MGGMFRIAVDGGTLQMRQDRPFLKEASNTPPRNIGRKQSNVANRK
jgi:hypothetical protein